MYAGPMFCVSIPDRIFNIKFLGWTYCIQNIALICFLFGSVSNTQICTPVFIELYIIYLVDLNYIQDLKKFIYLLSFQYQV